MSSLLLPGDISVLALRVAGILFGFRLLLLFYQIVFCKLSHLHFANAAIGFRISPAASKPS